MKQLIKHILGQMIYKAGLQRVLMNHKALVVIFHRIDDDVGVNPIVSCNQKQFTQYCKFFKQYFDVVSLTDLYQCLHKGDDITGKLVITFDDGYKDNYTIAAPILVENNLPACFFVVTNFIGSDHQAWWDNDLGFTSEWMTWDDVRDLTRQGFEIGSHTSNHNDLNFLSAQQAKREIVESITKIYKETGKKPLFFANPYGRSNTIKAHNLKTIQENFQINVGATGQLVKHASNRYFLERNNITPWYYSPFAFGLQMLFDKAVDVTNRPIKGNYINEVNS